MDYTLSQRLLEIAQEKKEHLIISEFQESIRFDFFPSFFFCFLFFILPIRVWHALWDCNYNYEYCLSVVATAGMIPTAKPQKRNSLIFAFPFAHVMEIIYALGWKFANSYPVFILKLNNISFLFHMIYLISINISIFPNLFKLNCVMHCFLILFNLDWCHVLPCVYLVLSLYM